MTRGNIFKLKHGRFRSDISKKFSTVRMMKHWNGFLGEVVDAQSLEVLIASLVEGDPARVRGVGTRRSLIPLLNQDILWFFDFHVSCCEVYLKCGWILFWFWGFFYINWKTVSGVIFIWFIKNKHSLSIYLKPIWFSCIRIVFIIASSSSTWNRWKNAFDYCIF